MDKSSKPKGKRLGRKPLYDEDMVDRHFFIRKDQDKRLNELSQGGDKARLVREAIDEKYMSKKIKYVG